MTHRAIALLVLLLIVAVAGGILIHPAFLALLLLALFLF